MKAFIHFTKHDKLVLLLYLLIKTIHIMSHLNFLFLKCFYIFVYCSNSLSICDSWCKWVGFHLKSNKCFKQTNKTNLKQEYQLMSHYDIISYSFVLLLGAFHGILIYVSNHILHSFWLLHSKQHYVLFTLKNMTETINLHKGCWFNFLVTG